MRPIASEQNPLRYPLNELLGSQAHVRLLRVMANEVNGPLSVSDLAKHGGLTVPGAQKALGKLYQSGFISRVGGGRKHQYEIRRSDILTQSIVELFKAENDRYEQLLTKIKNIIKRLTPYPYAVWIQAVSGEFGEPLTLGLLHEIRHLTDYIRQFRIQLNQVEKGFDLTIEVKGYTKADISGMGLQSITVLYGFLPLPDSPVRQQIKRLPTHHEKDQFLSELSCKLAKAIEQDVSLIQRAKEYVNRLLKEDQGMASKDIKEWCDILDMYPVQRLSRFLTSSSDRAIRLRQSNPFMAILNPDEQSLLINGLEEKNDT